MPYEAAARTLTESQERFSTQLKRDGLAITMEHNFMMSEEGRKNFYYRLMQVSMTLPLAYFDKLGYRCG